MVETELCKIFMRDRYYLQKEEWNKQVKEGRITETEARTVRESLATMML